MSHFRASIAASVGGRLTGVVFRLTSECGLFSGNSRRGFAPVQLVATDKLAGYQCLQVNVSVSRKAHGPRLLPSVNCEPSESARLSEPRQAGTVVLGSKKVQPFGDLTSAESGCLAAGLNCWSFLLWLH